MADDGSIVFRVDADDKEAQKKLDKLRREIERAEKTLAATDSKHNGLVEALDNASKAAEKTKAEIKEIRDQIAENDAALSGQTDGKISFEEFNARKQAQAELAYELKEQEKTYAAQVKQVEKLSAQEQAVKKTLDEQTENLRKQRSEAGAVVETMAKQSKSVLPAIHAQTQEITKSMRNGVKSILKWGFGIRSAFILMRKLRSAIVEGFTAYYQHDEETKATMDELKRSLKELKVSWGAAFAPIVNTVAPLLQTLISWLTRAANAVAQFFALLGGKSSYKKAVVVNTEETGELADTYDDTAESAKEAKREIMGFDEINKLSAETTGASNKEKAKKSSDKDDGISLIDTPITSAAALKFGEIVETIKKHLLDLQLFGYGMALGLGLMLTLSGANIPLGLALIALGAYGLAKTVTENWGKITESVQSTLGAIQMVVGGMLLGLGAVLAFTGANVPLGLALMALGAVSLAAGIALNWEELPENIRRVIGFITLAVGGALLALGAVLAFTGANIPLGVGLMALGALNIASGLAINWDYLKGNISNVVSAIGMVLGGALLALGAIILFATPAFSPLGLGLLIAGAATLAASVAVNWDYLSKKLQGKVGEIVAIISGALLVLGVILAFSGVALPLGIGLIAAGAVGLATTAVLNWDKIVNEINKPLGRIMAVLGVSLLAVGAILAFSGVGLPLGIALMLAGGASLGSAAALNWDAITNKVKTTLGNIKTAVQTGLDNVRTVINGRLDKIREAYDKHGGGVKGIFAGYMEVYQQIFGIGFDVINKMTGGRLDTLKQNVSTRFDNIKEYLTTTITKIRDLMNFQWAFPKPKMPHFTVTWQQLGQWFSLPRVSVSWYAKGGVFDKASLIGVGENGSEAVVPLERNTGWMQTVADGIASRLIDSKGFADAITGRTLPAYATGSITPPGTLGRREESLADALGKSVTDAINLAFANAFGNREENQPIVVNIGNEQLAQYIVTMNKRQALITGGRA